MTDMSLCTRISPDGTDNGLSGAIVDHVDYHNAFVGQYGAGDIQYLGHTSIKNLNNIYWKVCGLGPPTPVTPTPLLSWRAGRARLVPTGNQVLC